MMVNPGKDALRRQMKALRRALSSSAMLAASERVARKLLKKRELKRLISSGGTLAVYLASDGEVSLDGVIAAAVQAGVKVVSPRWNGAGYDLAAFASKKDLVRGPHGILEPVTSASVVPASEVMVWLVPGLAFSRKGDRLGYGGGWYDRLLASAAPDAVRIGVGYDFQMIDDVESEPHDIKMDSVVDDLAISLEIEESMGSVVMGIDEAGRGPLVGGVYAAAVTVPLNRARELLDGEWREIDDSKRLSESRREHLAEIIKSTPDCTWAVASASAAEIDKFNILAATHLAMKRAADEVSAALAKRGETAKIIVDGLPVKTMPEAKSVVKGDAKSLFIAAASILAKTARDADCLRLEKLYPGYGIARHKGYPTKDHLAALAKLGPCPEHRRSFGPVSQLQFEF